MKDKKSLISNDQKLNIQSKVLKIDFTLEKNWRSKYRLNEFIWFLKTSI